MAVYKKRSALAGERASGRRRLFTPCGLLRPPVWNAHFDDESLVCRVQGWSSGSVLCDSIVRFWTVGVS